MIIKVGITAGLMNKKKCQATCITLCFGGCCFLPDLAGLSNIKLYRAWQIFEELGICGIVEIIPIL